jgi:hypothetical protein
VDKVTYEALKNKCDAHLRTLPIQQGDYDGLHEELKELAKAVGADAPTLQGLSDEIGRIQSAKDRASEILAMAQGSQISWKRLTDALVDGYLSISDAKSLDKRKGDAQIHLGDYTIGFCRAEALLKHAQGVAYNLSDRHESASRRITCISLQLKISDFGGESMVGSMSVPRDASDVFDSDPKPGTGEDTGGTQEISW